MHLLISPYCSKKKKNLFAVLAFVILIKLAFLPGIGKWVLNGKVWFLMCDNLGQ